LTIGFLGFGRISHAVLTRLLAFTKPLSDPQAPRCVYTTSRARPDQKQIDEDYTKRFGIDVRHVDKEELAKEADVLIVLCSLTKTTTNLVGEEFLGLMKPTSVLINCARVSPACNHPMCHNSHPSFSRVLWWILKPSRKLCESRRSLELVSMW
jgi:glyoxylate/hydroxypyruvate reductase